MITVTKVKSRWAFGPLLNTEQALALPDNSVLMPSNSGPLVIKFEGKLYQLRHYTIPDTMAQPSFAIDLLNASPLDMTDKFAPTRFLDFGVKPIEIQSCRGYWKFLTLTMPRVNIEADMKFPLMYYDHGICFADGSFSDEDDDQNCYMVYTISPGTFKTSNEWNDAGLYGRVYSALLATSAEINLKENENA